MKNLAYSHHDLGDKIRFLGEHILHDAPICQPGRIGLWLCELREFALSRQLQLCEYGRLALTRVSAYFEERPARVAASRVDCKRRCAAARHGISCDAATVLQQPLVLPLRSWTASHHVSAPALVRAHVPSAQQR